MAEIFTRFDPSQDIVSNLRQTVSSGMWSGGTGTLTTFFTSSTQSSSNGQYYYDLGLAVNPNNANIIHVGGVQHWISTDNGVTFTCPAKWSHPHKKEYVHADIHDINYFGNDLWFACDGGVFYSANGGTTISDRNVGLRIKQFYSVGTSYKYQLLSSRCARQWHTST